MREFTGKGYALNHHLDPEEVGKELTKLGKFTPIEVVDAARNPKSKLHKYFEWDDSKAAEAHRLHQARCLVLSIKFEDQETGESYRAFESVVIEDQKLYVPIQTITDSPDLVEQVLQSILRELLYWRAKHQRYQHVFGGVFDAIDEAEAALRIKDEKEAREAAGAGRGKSSNTTNKKANRKHNYNRGHATSSKSVRGKVKARNAGKTNQESQRG